MIHHIGKMNGDHAGFEGLLSVSADTANVMRIGEAHERDAGLLRPSNGLLHCLPRHDLPIAASPIKAQDRAIILHKLDRRVGL